jgi:hypothetical protein
MRALNWRVKADFVDANVNERFRALLAAGLPTRRFGIQKPMKSSV